MSIEAQLCCLEATVHDDWVDYNGHMNDAAYAALFSQGVDALMEWLGLDAAYRAEYSYTLYTLEMHIRYLCEAYAGQPLSLGVQLADFDNKRVHLVMDLARADIDALLATAEVMLMGMDTAAARPAPFPQAIANQVRQLWQGYGVAALPQGMGQPIGICRR